jgi:predicted metal-dependent peptidase
LIDQIYFIGYALNSIEGMMSSCVVMANISDNRYTSLYVSTYLDECPIININKSNLKHELISIIQDHPRINELSKLSRDYVEKFHSYRYFAIIFEDILLSLYQT